MNQIKILVRSKGTKTKAGKFVEVLFSDLGDGRIQDEHGNQFEIHVTSTDGGFLKGSINVPFKFPK